MARTLLTGQQIGDGTVQRTDMDVTTAGNAVIRRILAGTGISLISTGVDSGTGDVTVNASVTLGANSFFDSQKVQSKIMPGFNGQKLGSYCHSGYNSAGTQKDFIELAGDIITATAGAEASQYRVSVFTAGAWGTSWTMGANGLFAGGASGGGKGANTINATTLYEAGVALTSKYLQLTTTGLISVGYRLLPYNLGNITSFTVNPALGNYQYGSNIGAFTLTAPTSDCAVSILVTNGTAGAIIFSGFTVGPSVGDAFTTMNGNRFLIQIVRLNGTSTYWIKALQ